MARPRLKDYLDRLVAERGRRFLESDRLALVRRHPERKDREIAGWIASSLG